MKRKGLPLGAAIQMGLKSVRLHPIRMAVAIFLTVCSLVMFGLSVTAAFFNEDQSLAKSYYDYEPSTTLVKVDGDREFLPITNGDRDLLREKTGILFSPQGSGEIVYNSHMAFGEVFFELPYCLRFHEATYVSATSEAIAEAGYILVGRLPENEGEIAINSCYMGVFQRFGFYDYVGYPPVLNEKTGFYDFDERGKYSVGSAQELIDLGASFIVRDASGTGTHTAKIVGVVDYGECPTNENKKGGGYFDAIFISQEEMQKRMGEDKIGECLVAGKLASPKQADTLIKFCKEEGTYQLLSETVTQFESYGERLRSTKIVFTVMGLVFGAFAVLLIYQLISLSVEEKRGQVGILRALGAHSSDVYKIFFSESLFMAILSIVLSVPLLYLGCVAANKILYDFFLVKVAFMTFGVVPPLIVALIGIAVPLASTFFPVYKMAKKPPVDCIRDCT